MIEPREIVTNMMASGDMKGEVDNIEYPSQIENNCVRCSPLPVGELHDRGSHVYSATQVSMNLPELAVV